MSVPAISGSNHAQNDYPEEKQPGGHAPRRMRFTGMDTDTDSSVVFISDEAYEIYADFTHNMELQDEVFWSKVDTQIREFMATEDFARLEAELMGQFASTKAADTLDREFQGGDAEYSFPEDSLEHKVAKALDGQVRKPLLYASQLGRAIRATHGKSDATVQERALYRETAMWQAQYVAKNYLGHKAGIAFLDEVGLHARNDELREKGYYFVDERGTAYKSYSSAASPDEDNVNFDQIAERYRPGYLKKFYDGEVSAAEWKKFCEEITALRPGLANLVKQDFDENEAAIAAIIDQVKSEFTGLSTNSSSYVDDINLLLLNLKQPQIAKWNSNMLKLFL